MAESADKLTHREHAPKVARVLRALSSVIGSGRETRELELDAAVAAAGWDKLDPVSIYTTAADLLESLAREQSPPAELPLEANLALSIAVSITKRLGPGDLAAGIAHHRKDMTSLDSMLPNTPAVNAARLMQFAILIGSLMILDATGD